ncbi:MULTISPECIES: exosporium protein C [unclassified Bacillus (in: firmicutes)]|uniref:exosporium protein C n=1 Tax=unclassified Bacillus (in: firmicutes) TaxID=185979 RepID=UPI0008E3F27A|nr:MULTISPECIES: exosporium protein C [unclassified Bacillus (in: firmicutes)]SFI29770.1 hypothetical protein SAMN04488574_102262 [Bacillus sp. 71mf]SFS38753.1 hypothetical protein SAMN04488145_101204 [Bacillus sp. 103mf]
MTHIIDFQAIQPISKVNEVTFEIPHSPQKLKLASIKLRISKSDSHENKVELIGTVGVKGITGIAQILFKIFRDDKEIFNAQAGIESADSEQFYIETFQAIDKNLHSGSHVYTLTVENLTNNTRADVVGPISFSGLAISQNHDC